MSDGARPAVALEARRLSVSFAREAVINSEGTGSPRERRAIAVLDEVDVVVHAGELCVLAGPSGSGKTTLLNVLARFRDADHGDVVVPGNDRPSWREIAVVPQSLALLDELTLIDNVTLPLRLSGELARRAQHVDDLLDDLGLGHVAHHLPRESSLGERQRAAIARALVVEPAVVLLDEPTSHQDAANRDRALAALRASVERGAAVLAASHDNAVIATADRVLKLDRGRLSNAE